MSIYTPTDYVNGGEPAINDDNLNHSEEGVETAHEEIEEIADGTVSVKFAETCDSSRFIHSASQSLIGGIKAHNVTNPTTGEITTFLDSATLLDLPLAVMDLSVTDRLPGAIVATFTETSNSLWYDLYRDGLLIASNIVSGFEYPSDAGTWNFYILANNTFGSTAGNITEGSARAVPTAPPAAITDFSASDDEVQSITFDWTDHYDSYRFDIYSGTTLIEEDVVPGVRLPAPIGTASYSVKATNILGSVDSNTDDGTALDLTPSAINDLVATTGVAKITFTFSYVPQPVTYDLYKSGSLVRSGIYSGYVLNSPEGSWDFYIRAHNTLGFADSNTVTGTATPALYPPSYISDFRASDNEVQQITMDFSEAIDAERYDLHDTVGLVATDIYPGYVHNTSEGTWTFHVVASNTKGDVSSNTNDGTSLEAFTVAPDPVTNFTVSTEFTNAITISFTEQPNTVRYDLYRDNVKYKSDVHPADVFQTFAGEWEFFIRSINPIGTADSTIVTGSADSSTSAPGPIATFTATTGGTNLITMNWSESLGAARYDLYKENVKIREGVTSPYALQSPAGEWSFFVRAVNFNGSVDSPSAAGSAVAATLPPEAIVDFEASDDVRGSIFMTFSDSLYAVTYDLYETDVLIEPNILSGYELVVGGAKTATYFVTANNDLPASVPSNSNEGIALAHLNPPSKITDLVATTGQVNQVTVTFTPATDATSHDLYYGGALATAGIVSGYVYPIDGPSSGEYMVRAINDEHYTDSDAVTGGSVAFLPGDVTIDYDDYTFNGTGDGTVVIAAGVGTFTPPAGVEEVTVCIVGGGGSGACHTDENPDNDKAYGGYNGNPDTSTVSLDPDLAVNIVVGLGGSGLSVSDPTDGRSGTLSSFGTYIDALGGEGGKTNECGYTQGFYGDGAEYTSCFGTNFDGTTEINSGGNCGFFGCGGQSSGAGKGGNGLVDVLVPAEAGGIGSGGGGIYTSEHVLGESGAGGNGQIKISWG